MGELSCLHRMMPLLADILLSLFFTSAPDDEASRLQDALDVISPDNQLDASVLIVSWKTPDHDDELVEQVSPRSALSFAALHR